MHSTGAFHVEQSCAHKHQKAHSHGFPRLLKSSSIRSTLNNPNSDDTTYFIQSLSLLLLTSTASLAQTLTKDATCGGSKGLNCLGSSTLPSTPPTYSNKYKDGEVVAQSTVGAAQLIRIATMAASPSLELVESNLIPVQARARQ